MTKIIRLLLALGLFMPGARTDAQPIGIEAE